MKRYPFILCILLCLFFRAITLEYPDLIDPTESRYAFVAQEMYLSGDWIVPKLPWRGTVEPYLGKPPLHFWLTSTTFSLFGMDEWACRLPSFFGLIAMIGCLLSFRRFSEFKEVGAIAPLILISSALIYFMSGASVVDVTLAACLSGAFTAAFYLLKTGNRSASLWMFVGVALGFMTKGPIALAILGLPALLWIIVTRRYDAFKLPRWWQGIAAFLAITVPWFVLAQQRNPDFLRYFFINENFGRYLLNDYGDRYGSGHKYPYGTIWGLYILGFLPWTIPLFIEIWNKRKSVLRLDYWRTRPDHLFFLLWALSPAIIFTFAKQLHAAYVLPGVPGLALLTASFLGERSKSELSKVFHPLTLLILVLGVAGLVSGFAFGTESFYVTLSLLPLAALILCARHLQLHGTSTTLLAVATVSGFAITNLSYARNIGERRSAEPMLRCITHNENGPEAEIGIVNANAYSLYYYTRAWREEFEKPIRASFFRLESMPDSLPEHLLMRNGEVEKVLAKLPPGYVRASASKSWTWLHKGTSEAPIICTGDVT